MGRHRPDPRGHARILVAIAAVALALALLVIGGIALFGALTSGPAGSVSPSQGTTPAGNRTTLDPVASSSPARAPTLQIRVTGAPTRVFVAVPGGNPAGIRQNGVLATGEARKYDDDRLDVVVDNGAAVQVSINGKPQAQGPANQRQSWTAQRAS